MILQQIYLGCLSHASYLIGDERTRSAAIVDPQRDIDGYLAEAKKRGLSIDRVFLTHFHADFVAGHIELAARSGAKIHLGAKARAEFEFVALQDGDAIEFGDVRLEILATPGHTPEGISIVVFDLAQDPRTPRAVLTGDTLFIGDVGRPDLLAAEGWSARDLASAMYDTLRTKFAQLPDSVTVYPAHGAGSACGKQMSQDTFSSLGLQRNTNWAMQPMEREEFIRQLTCAQAEFPPYFAFDSAQNRKQRITLEENLAQRLLPLTLEQALARAQGGALILDVREPAEWCAGHLVGSINVGLSGKFASWVGALIPSDRELLLVAPPGKQREAALRLGRIGFDRIAGFLDGGERAWSSRADLVRSSRRVDAPRLAQELAREPRPLLLDVRTQAEWDEGHLAGALHLPLTHLEARANELPRGRAIAIHCKGGYRSVIAASLLERAGLGPLCDLEGGYMAWLEAQQPVVQDPVRT